MKLGCISWSYCKQFDDGTFDLLSWIKHCAEDLRLDGVELWNNHFTSLDDDYLKQIVATAKRYGIPIYSVASKCIYGDFSTEQVQKAQQTLETWMGVAVKLGSPLLRISIGGDALRDPQHQKIVFQSMAETVEKHRGLGITVGIENQEPGIVQNAQDVQLMHEVSQGSLKLILDNGSIIDKSTVYDFMEQTLPYAAVVHAKFFQVADDGSDKVLDYMKIRDIVAASSYRDFVSIEYDGKGVPSEDVSKIATFLRKIWG